MLAMKTGQIQDFINGCVGRRMLRGALDWTTGLESTVVNCGYPLPTLYHYLVCATPYRSLVSHMVRPDQIDLLFHGSGGSFFREMQ